MNYWILRKDIKVLNGVIEDDARHGNASQGIGHIDSGIS
jgi:hypothetical protein